MRFFKKFIANSDSFFLSEDNKYIICLPAEIKFSPPYNSSDPLFYNTGNLPFFRVTDGYIYNYTEFRSSEGNTFDCCNTINVWQNDNFPHINTYIPYAQGYGDLDYREVTFFDIDNLASPHIGQIFLLDDFYTNLYPELLDNEETKLSLQDWIDDDGAQRWDTLTDKDLKAMELIEKYNKNVLLLRSTRKVQASVSGSISSSDGGSSVNLSGVENKLQNINDSLNTLNGKLEVEEQVDGDVEIKTLTQVVKDLDLSNQTVITTVEKPPYNPLLDDGEIF